jgi:hypothetical protein
MAMGRMRSLGTLSGDRLRALMLAWLMLPLVDLSLRITSMVRVRRRLGTVSRWLPLEPARDPHAAARADYRLVAAAARRQPWSMGCLRRTLVLEALLRARGVATDLHFGARREGQGLVAHCWLELDGVPVGESAEDLAHYVPLHPVKRREASESEEVQIGL